MRSVFERWALRRHLQGDMDRRTLFALVRTMRGHRAAVLSGDAWPMVPRVVNRHWRLAVMWSLFRLSVEQPVVFTWSLVAMPIGVVMLVVIWGERLLRALGVLFS